MRPETLCKLCQTKMPLFWKLQFLKLGVYSRMLSGHAHFDGCLKEILSRKLTSVHLEF
jgi:hypothetical protein